MSRQAFILGGTGQIGRAVALDLLAAGWNVTVSHRGTYPPPERLIERGAKVAVLDRSSPGDLSRALGTGADALIDTTAYELDHARQLIAVQDSVGSFIVISSTSVYKDGLGRTLDEASQNGFPELPDPIPETHPTVDPGPTTYSTRKMALERHLLDCAATPVTILRPARSMDRVPAIRGNGGSSNASSIIGRPYLWLIGGQAAFTHPPSLTLPH